jgi:hypothetical protein
MRCPYTISPYGELHGYWDWHFVGALPIIQDIEILPPTDIEIVAKCAKWWNK